MAQVEVLSLTLAFFSRLSPYLPRSLLRLTDTRLYDSIVALCFFPAPPPSSREGKELLLGAFEMAVSWARRLEGDNGAREGGKEVAAINEAMLLAIPDIKGMTPLVARRLLPFIRVIGSQKIRYTWNSHTVYMHAEHNTQLTKN